MFEQLVSGLNLDHIISAWQIATASLTYIVHQNLVARVVNYE